MDSRDQFEEHGLAHSEPPDPQLKDLGEKEVSNQIEQYGLTLLLFDEPRATP